MVPVASLLLGETAIGRGGYKFIEVLDVLDVF